MKQPLFFVLLIAGLFFHFSLSAKHLKMVVREHKAACTGVAPMECLLVQYPDSKDWELFYGGIEGFNYQEGTRYTLLVNRKKARDVPADAPAYTYKLKKIIRMDAVVSATTLDSTQWLLQSIKGEPTTVTTAFIRFDLDAQRCSGSGGCNRFFGSVKHSPDKAQLSFGNIGATLMACMDEATTRTETAFIVALNGKTLDYELKGTELILYENKKALLTFRKEKEATHEIQPTVNKKQQAALPDQGITGTIYWLEGNHMPSIGGPNKNAIKKTVRREVVVYEPTTPEQVTTQDGIFYGQPQTKKIRSTWSDDEGRYALDLPEGTYSVFVLEEGHLYANRFDGEGIINPVKVGKSQVTTLDISINYKAAY